MKHLNLHGWKLTIFPSLISIPSGRRPLPMSKVASTRDEEPEEVSDDGIQEGRLLGGTVGMILMCLFLIWKYHAHMLHVCYIYLHVFRANVGKYSIHGTYGMGYCVFVGTYGLNVDKHIGNYRILIIHGFHFWVQLTWWKRIPKDVIYIYNRLISWDGGCFHAVSWGFNEELRGKEHIRNQPKNRYYDRIMVNIIYIYIYIWYRKNNLTIYHIDL